MKQLHTCSSLNLHCYPKDSLSDYIREGLLFHKKMGFDAADLDLDFPEWYHDGVALPHVIEQIARNSQEIGVPIALCHLPFSRGNSKSEEGKAQFSASMHSAIDMAVLLGVDYAVLHPNALPMPMKDFCLQSEYDRVMKTLAPFVEHANRVGLSVVIENMGLYPAPILQHRYCQTPEELCHLADALGIGICWDFGHANLSGIRQSDGLSYIGKRLKVLHVNDNFGVADEHLAPFLGTVNWKDAMHGLALTGFDGLLNFEVSAARIPASARPSFTNYLKDAATALMNYIE